MRVKVIKRHRGVRIYATYKVVRFEDVFFKGKQVSAMVLLVVKRKGDPEEVLVPIHKLDILPGEETPNAKQDEDLIRYRGK